MTTDIKVPTLGESVTEATVGQWFKKEGESVSRDEPLVELETDKVTLEVPAPADGELASIVVKEGETVEVGALLGSIGEGGGKAAAKPAAKPAEAKKAEKPEPAKGNGKSNGKAKPEKAESGEEGGELVDIVVPAAGESVTEADVGEWLKSEGDEVAMDEALVELETDKAAQEIPAQAKGVLVEILKKQGETVEVGDVLGRIRVGAKAGGEKAAPAKAAAEEAKAETRSEAPAGDKRPPAPSADKMIKEKGLAEADIDGSGKEGQVLKEDVLKALEGGGGRKPEEAKPSAPRAPAPVEDEGREVRVKMTRLRQTIARRLKEAQDTAAMLTTFNDVDMGAVMELRKTYRDLFEKKHGVKLGFMGFFVKAAVAALKEIPAVNAEIDGNELVYKNYYHVGVAVGTDKGLVVPVVRDAQDMSIAEIEKKIGELGKRARDGQLTLDDMQGGTFTISNGGVYGSLMSTPILNAPQSGILGMHRIEERPVVRNGQIVARPMMYLALSYDHRIVDGQEAVTFLVRIKEAIEDPQRLVLDL